VRNRQLRVSAKKIDFIRIEWLFGGNATPVVGELYVRVKKSSGVARLTTSHENCTLCSFVLCSLMKSINCRRYLTGSIFALPFLTEEP